MRKSIVKCTFVSMWRKFSPILTILFKYFKKFEGFRKFVLENPSYIFVFGPAKDILLFSISDLFGKLY
jgi:hypothetical protein